MSTLNLSPDLYWDIPIRLALGMIFTAHGFRKLFGWFGGRDYQEMPKSFKRLEPTISQLLMTSAGFVQLIGAFLVLCGFWTRIGALFLFAEVLIGIPLAHSDAGFFINWKNEQGKGNGIEYNLAIIGLTLALMIAGGGHFSIDGYLLRSEGLKIHANTESISLHGRR